MLKHYMQLEEYMEANDLESSRQIAEHFDIGQTTAMRWLKNETLWVVAGGDMRWIEVYTERTLKKREE